jgi:IclR family transcriptional regulator, pca regulon regulatory protein
MQPDESGGVRGASFVQSLDRGLAVIRAFDADRRELTLSDVARITGLTRAAARRFLHSLVALGYVRTDGRLFALRPRVLELSRSYLSVLGLPAVALPHMEELADQLGESCSMAVLDGDDIVYVARVPGQQIMTIAISVGTRLPAHATSMGRVLLAFTNNGWLDAHPRRTALERHTRFSISTPAQLAAVLTRVREEGYCLVDQELEEGLRSIAVPVRDARGDVVAALNVSTHAGAGDVESMRARLLRPLLDTAQRINEALRSDPPAG